MIGVSLSPALFRPETASEAGQLLLSQAGGCQRLLAMLRDAGVSSVELRNVFADADPDDTVETVHRLADAGLGFTVHGGMSSAQTVLRDVLPPLEKVLREYAPLVTLHVLPTEEETKEALQRLLAEGAPIRIALENSRKLPGGEYGDTKPMVARIVGAVDHPGLGICWDMGHDWFNVLRERGDDRAVLPPPEFSGRVIHTHIHGVVNGRTHFPPNHQNLPLESWCRALPKASLWNLELEPERYFTAIPPLPALLDSVRLLAETERKKP